ncbi:hypothetical protein [Collimonas sp.]|jgi:hypothetical protein|uniref:hypothetical protein n=1 Tax=Collimonas sp. TaxID=1963772 RepID=UPI002C623102|nr:hypothetical protein [Collimonas sp.]HWX01429.1 hypothetical protein [Collimonas sp.]
MGWYKVGKIAVTNGSKAITGSGTDFVSNIKQGFALLGPDFQLYEIDAVVSATSVTLATPYRGATAAVADYGIFQTQGIIADLSTQVAVLINSYGGIVLQFPDVLASITAAQARADLGVANAAAAQNTANAAVPKSGGAAYNLTLTGVLQATDTFYAVNQYAYRVLYGTGWGPEIQARWDGSTVNRWLQFGYRNNANAYTCIMHIDTNAPGIVISPNASRVMGGSMFEVNNTIAVVPAVSQGVGAANQSASCLYVGGSTGRSISASSTINASGSDYAEYMTKAGEFVIEKGAIAGLNASGQLTNSFSEALSFLVKSTDPSYVGGDTWGHAGIVGVPPTPIFRMEGAEATEDFPAKAPESDADWGARQEKYDQEMAIFHERIETVRKQVDRMAFCGQVPVNVLGAAPGDYIIPVADAGGIKGIAVRSPNIDQYMIAVGKVVAIEDDGRARIIVKAV